MSRAKHMHVKLACKEQLSSKKNNSSLCIPYQYYHLVGHAADSQVQQDQSDSPWCGCWDFHGRQRSSHSVDTCRACGQSEQCACESSCLSWAPPWSRWGRGSACDSAGGVPCGASCSLSPGHNVQHLAVGTFYKICFIPIPRYYNKCNSMFQ